MLRRSLGALALATMLLVACSSGDGRTSGDNLTLVDVQQATAQARTAVIAGVRTVGRESGPVAGKYQADPPAGVYTAPVFVPGSNTAQAEVRFLDGQTYVSRAPVPVTARQSAQLLMPDYLGMRVGDEAQWLKLPAVLGTAVGTPLLQGPFALLDALVKGNATITKQGRGQVDGTSVTSYSVAVTSLVQYRIGSLTIDVDTKRRLRRVATTGATRIQYTVGDFGTSVDVSVPPTGETTDKVPGSGPPAPRPAGAFSVAAAGAAGGLSWTLSKANGTRGATCWKLATTPAIEMTEAAAVQCQLPTDPKADGVGRSAQFPFQSKANGPYDILVGTVPDVRRATFLFTDTKTAGPTFIDAANGIVVWAGKSRPFLGAATMTLADGQSLSCGPGDIVSIDQLYGKDETALLDYRKYPWGCLEN